jgi:hypothetical protein
MKLLNTRSWLALTFIVLFTGTAGLLHAKPVASCNAPASHPTEVIVTRPMARVPVGLYYMQVYLVVSRYLKKTAWYFAPDGTVYAEVEGGLTPADLARHKGWKGRARMLGNEMEIRWTDGSVYKTEFIPKNGGFDWATSESGMFLAVKPFANWQQLVGSYEGGMSSSSGGGYVATSRTITLRPDGSYTREGIASLGSSNDGTGTQARAGGQSQNGGTWRFDGQYSIQFTDRTGKTSRYLVFPAIDGIYVEDTFCKRLR